VWVLVQWTFVDVAAADEILMVNVNAFVVLIVGLVVVQFVLESSLIFEDPV
jgi:hypothetical protein